MELVKASKMHLYLVSFGRYLRYQCGGICWKRGESSFVGWVVGSSLTLSYVRISGFPHWMPGSLGFPTISVVLLKVRKSRSQHRHQSIFWSFSAVWALLWLRKIQFTIASCPCDFKVKILAGYSCCRHQYDIAMRQQLSTGEKWLQEFIVLYDYV